MLRLRSLTFQGLVLSCRSFTRWSVKFLSSKLCAEFCWFLCSCIFNNYVEKSKFWNRKINKSENILRCIYFKIISANVFEDLVCTNKLEVFFLKNWFFSETWSFFNECKTTNLGVIFCTRKLLLHLFSSVIISF